MSDEAVAPVVVETPEVASSLEAELEAVAPVEAAPEVAPAQTKEEKQWASRFAALTRKEKSVRDLQKATDLKIKALEAQLAAQKPAAVQEEALEPLEVRLKKNPFATLESLGMNYETLTQIALNNGKLTPELQMQLMEEKLTNKYKSELDAVNKRLSERELAEQQQRESATIQNFKDQIGSAIVSGGEASELLASEGDYGTELVFNIIDVHHQETGDVLDIKEAVAMAEEELLNQAKKRIELNKIKKLMGASQAKIPVKPQQEKKASVTLSNESSQVQSAASHFMSDDESKREAAKLIKFNA